MPPVSKANKTIIAPCTCTNEYQDKTYGVGQRVKNSNAAGYRCVVCGKVLP